MLILTDGEKHEGAWLNDERNGPGICIFKDGSEYDGEWCRGFAHGPGNMTWPNGDRFSGQWKFGSVALSLSLSPSFAISLSHTL